MKISDLKVNRIIRRPTKNVDYYGNRIFEEFEYEFKYKPYFKNSETQRLFAKIIDILPFFLILFLIFNQHVFLSFLCSVPLVIIYCSIFESIFGTTLGKKVFKLMVIDEYAQKPEILKSLKRNCLCLINFFPTFTDLQDRTGVWKTVMNFNMHLNNKFSKTYIVKEKMVNEIKGMLKEQTLI